MSIPLDRRDVPFIASKFCPVDSPFYMPSAIATACFIGIAGEILGADYDDDKVVLRFRQPFSQCRPAKSLAREVQMASATSAHSEVAVAMYNRASDSGEPHLTTMMRLDLETLPSRTSVKTLDVDDQAFTRQAAPDTCAIRPRQYWLLGTMHLGAIRADSTSWSLTFKCVDLLMRCAHRSVRVYVCREHLRQTQRLAGARSRHAAVGIRARLASAMAFRLFLHHRDKVSVSGLGLGGTGLVT